MFWLLPHAVIKSRQKQFMGRRAQSSQSVPVEKVRQEYNVCGHMHPQSGSRGRGVLKVSFRLGPPADGMVLPAVKVPQFSQPLSLHWHAQRHASW